MSLRRTLQFALALAVASVALAFGNAAGATGNPDYTAPPPTSVVHNSVPKTVRQAPATPVARQQLAITGSDMNQFALIGGVLVAAGAGTLVLRRRTAA